MIPFIRKYYRKKIDMKVNFRISFFLFATISLILMGTITSPASAPEELEKPQIPPPLLEKPKIPDFKGPDTKGVSPIPPPVKPSFFPNGVSVDFSGNVFVSDRGHEDEAQYRMIKYTNNGGFIKSWGKFGSGNSEFNNPRGVGVDIKGNVFVADTLNDRIQKFNNNGGFINSWKIGGNVIGPADVDADVHPPFDNVYVADTEKDRILVYTNNGANMFKSWGKFGSSNGDFHTPLGVSVDIKSNIFVADAGNHRIQKFQLARLCREGQTQITLGVCFIKSWGTKGTDNGQFNHPNGISVDSKGNVFVADLLNYRIQKFTNNGDFIKSWGKPGTGNGEFNAPTDVDVDPNTGYVFVADVNNNRIQKFDNNGMFISKWFLSGVP